MYQAFKDVVGDSNAFSPFDKDCTHPLQRPVATRRVSSRLHKRWPVCSKLDARNGNVDCRHCLRPLDLKQVCQRRHHNVGWRGGTIWHEVKLPRNIVVPLYIYIYKYRRQRVCGRAHVSIHKNGTCSEATDFERILMGYLHPRPISILSSRFWRVLVRWCYAFFFLVFLKKRTFSSSLSTHNIITYQNSLTVSKSSCRPSINHSPAVSEPSPPWLPPSPNLK